MLYRSVIKMFASSRNSYLRKFNGAVNIFGNYRSITPLSTTKFALSDAKVKVVFNTIDGRRIETEGKVGDTLLDVVVNNNIDLDGYGACEGTITCSTCHVLLSQADYDRIPEISDEERELLVIANGLTDTSRLGCQVTLTKELDGLEVKVPEIVKDARKS